VASILAASPGGANASTVPRAARKEKLLVGYNAPMIAKLVIRLRLDPSACTNLRLALAWAVEKWERFGIPHAYEGPNRIRTNRPTAARNTHTAWREDRNS